MTNRDKHVDRLINQQNCTLIAEIDCKVGALAIIPSFEAIPVRKTRLYTLSVTFANSSCALYQDMFPDLKLEIHALELEPFCQRL